MESWIEDLRSAFGVEFGRDWRQHVADINARLRLSDPYTLHSYPQRPPEFFLGDLESFVPGQWVAVVSLNPGWSGEWDDWEVAQEWTEQSCWDYLNRRDLRSSLDGRPYVDADYATNWTFHRHLARLASAALGIPYRKEDESATVVRRIGFFEIVPYPSRSLKYGMISELVESDPGSAISLKAAHETISHRLPAAVFVNGYEALDPVAVRFDVELRPDRYESAYKPGKTLEHWEGMISVGGVSVPVFGFRQRGPGPLRHNAYLEWDQLASRVAEVMPRHD